jgi:trk system potassium uptake protein
VAVTAPSRGRPAAIDLRPIMVVIGLLLIILALFMAPPMAAGHPVWRVFLGAGAVTLFTGVTLVLMNQGYGNADLTRRQAFLLTTSGLDHLALDRRGRVVVGWFAALPLAFSELDLTLADAVFESVSGITMTGSTVIVGLDVAPPGILLWRAILIGLAVSASSSWPSRSCRC